MSNSSYAQYRIEDHCHEAGCSVLIDHGMAYRCDGCGDFFCFAHLFHSLTGSISQHCPSCLKEREFFSGDSEDDVERAYNAAVDALEQPSCGCGHPMEAHYNDTPCPDEYSMCTACDTYQAEHG